MKEIVQNLANFGHVFHEKCLILTKFRPEKFCLITYVFGVDIICFRSKFGEKRHCSWRLCPGVLILSVGWLLIDSYPLGSLLNI